MTNHRHDLINDYIFIIKVFGAEMDEGIDTTTDFFLGISNQLKGIMFMEVEKTTALGGL